jgi:hypothetical protein
LFRFRRIGTQAAVTSAPDGATFLVVFDTHGVNPSPRSGIRSPVLLQYDAVVADEAAHQKQENA